MDTQLIRSEESRNNGLYINLYLNEQIGSWCAFGYSAYRLFLFDEKQGCLNFCSYSREFQMSCTVTSGESIILLLQSPVEIVTQSDSFIKLKVQGELDYDSYYRWINSLKGYPLKENEFSIKTHVSEFVPKEGFIADGMSAFARNVKRIGDCIMAFIALLVFSPLFLFCYIAIRLEDGGPAIFKQERIGRFGRPFYIYKFRSMRLDAEKYGPQLSHSGGDGDPRLTRIGRFIRAHHLDELPQLYNVLIGDMAFIGPRPERKFYIEQIIEHDSRYIFLYQIRPGVTSYATLYNGYTDTMEKMLRRLEYDLYYLGHRSWLFDFKILFNTFCSIVLGKKF